jgi:hypothetical protein
VWIPSISRFNNQNPERAAVRDYFTRLTGLFRNFNYAATDAPEYQRLGKPWSVRIFCPLIRPAISRCAIVA